MAASAAARFSASAALPSSADFTCVCLSVLGVKSSGLAPQSQLQACRRASRLAVKLQHDHAQSTRWSAGVDAPGHATAAAACRGNLRLHVQIVDALNPKP